MPFVELHYGPYESNGIIRHRIQRLHGLIKCLTGKGYEIEIFQTDLLNRLTVIMRCATVFQCNIQNLLFNLEYEDDVVCQRAVAAIEEATDRLYNDTNIPKYGPIQEGMRAVNKRMFPGSVADFFAPSVGVMFEIGGTAQEAKDDPDYLIYPSNRFRSRERLRPETPAMAPHRYPVYPDEPSLLSAMGEGSRDDPDASYIESDWSLYRTRDDPKPLSKVQTAMEKSIGIIDMKPSPGDVDETQDESQKKKSALEDTSVDMAVFMGGEEEGEGEASHQLVQPLSTPQPTTPPDVTSKVSTIIDEIIYSIHNLVNDETFLATSEWLGEDEESAFFDMLEGEVAELFELQQDFTEATETDFEEEEFLQEDAVPMVEGVEVMPIDLTGVSPDFEDLGEEEEEYVPMVEGLEAMPIAIPGEVPEIQHIQEIMGEDGEMIEFHEQMIYTPHEEDGEYFEHEEIVYPIYDTQENE